MTETRRRFATFDGATLNVEANGIEEIALALDELAQMRAEFSGQKAQIDQRLKDAAAPEVKAGLSTDQQRLAASMIVVDRAVFQIATNLQEQGF